MTRTDSRQEWLCVSRVFPNPGDLESSYRKCLWWSYREPTQVRWLRKL